MTEPVRTVYDEVAAAAGESAEAIALVFQGRSYTYAEFVRLVDRTAETLLGQGLTAGRTFAVYARNCPEILACYCASAKLGAVMVPINPNMSAKEVAQVLDHCEARLLFHDALVEPAAAQAVPSSRRRRLDVLAEGDARPVIPHSPAAADDFTIVYTSGSTGTPKAIVLSHKSQVDVLSALTAMWGLSRRDTTLVALPLGYLYGLSTAAIAGLKSGGKVVLLPRFHPAEVLEAMVRHRATMFHGVPTMFSMMLDYAEQQGLAFDLSGVRALICAGAPLAPELRARFERRFGKAIQNYYALSECTPVFGSYAADTDPLPDGALGRLAPMAQARIVDETGRDCPSGVAGELLVRGAALMSRYHRDPVSTSAVFVDGWFKTGDLACETSPGYFAIVGRKKDVIIRGGANISPAEVEAAMMRHPSVRQAVVVGMPDRIFGEIPVAIVALRQGEDATAEDLTAFVLTELAAFKVPARIAFVDAMPLGPTGKIDRNGLKARLVEFFQ